MASRMSTATVTAGLVATATILAVMVQRGRAPPSPEAIPSPRTKLSHLSHEEISALPYPPNLLPGARDVDTPYGSMRVYEWGPENGPKVVMVAGDTTPAPIFGKVAMALVARGMRVLTIDTWGRGFSDAPRNVTYNFGLFVMQIFFALSSSPLPWTGEASGGFSLIGFSLGGSVAMSFVARYPYLVNSVVLLAPGGLIKILPEGYESFWYRFRKWLPASYLRRRVAATIGVDLRSDQPRPTGPAEPVTVDTLDLPALWQWQFDHHEGFVHAFIETSQDGPLREQHEDWRQALAVIGTRQAGVEGDGSLLRSGHGKVLVIFGEDDGIVPQQLVREEIMRLAMNAEAVLFRAVPGGHSFPIDPSGAETADHIIAFWGLNE